MRITLIFIVAIFLGGCSKEKEDRTESFCYETQGVRFDFNIPDTIYFGQKTSIRGYVSQPLTMKFTIDSVVIGEIHESGNLIWTPSKNEIKAGQQTIDIEIKICNIPNKSFIIGASQKTVFE